MIHRLLPVLLAATFAEASLAQGNPEYLGESELGTGEKTYLLSVRPTERNGYRYADILVVLPKKSNHIERFDGQGLSVYEPVEAYQSYVRQSVLDCNLREEATLTYKYYSGTVNQPSTLVYEERFPKPLFFPIIPLATEENLFDRACN